MSNINKQARDKLKSAAAKAADNFDPNMFVETRDVLALLDELGAKDRRIEEEIGRANREHHRGFMMACGHLKQHSNVHYADAAEMEIAALRERIAELTEFISRVKKCLERNGEYAPLSHEEIDTLLGIRAAGISIKGE